MIKRHQDRTAGGCEGGEEGGEIEMYGTGFKPLICEWSGEVTVAFGAP